MEDDKPTARVMAPMGPKLLERIDAWRFANRIDSRAEAIRLLVNEALDARAKAAERREGRK